jgi:hypothetical protein
MVPIGVIRWYRVVRYGINALILSPNETAANSSQGKGTHLRRLQRIADFSENFGEVCKYLE